MVSKTQLGRLSQRIAALAQTIDPAPAVIVGEWHLSRETEQEALDRLYASRPNAQRARLYVLIKRFCLEERKDDQRRH